MIKKKTSEMEIQENFTLMNINKSKEVNKKLRKSIKDLESGKTLSNKKEIYFNTKNLSPSPSKNTN